jgi:hypothetical protein
MRRIAMRVALIGLFGLAFVGWACGLTPLACATRALVGAVVLYVLARLAARVVVAALAEAAARSPRQGAEGEGAES